jgi:hypothetical protein
MSTCHCFCGTWHPDSAQSGACARASTPGLTVLATGTLVGTVPVPVCRPCFDAHHHRISEQPGGGPGR